jgi:hypothetical protein
MITLVFFYVFQILLWPCRAEIGLDEYFSMAKAVGTIATLFVVLCLSRKQMQSISMNLETKTLNDLDEKINGLPI